MRRAMPCRVLFVVLLLAVAAPAVAKPELSVPADLSVPDPGPVRLTGLAPGDQVTLETFRATSAGMILTGAALFRADASGEVDTATLAPLAGDYREVDPLGLFWSATRSLDPAAPAPMAGHVTIRARSGDAIIAQAEARIGPDPQTLTTETAPFPGAFITRPADNQRHPVVIVLGGSEGGDKTARAMAPLFAAQGYFVVGLPYYAPARGQVGRIAGLPESFTNIAVDRLARVRDWLRHQPRADAAAIGLWGVSKGAEFAAIAAAHYDWLRAVALIVPSDVVWEGWGKDSARTSSFAFEGHSLAFVPYLGIDLEFARLSRGEPMQLVRAHRAGRAAYPERIAAARIPLERYTGALLVAGGRDDRIWPSAEMAEAIVRERADAGLPTVSLVFERAGHALAGPGSDPVADYTANGGEAPFIARARAELWRATARFFKRNLAPSGNAGR
ncbi:MAG: hypothetical protein B7Y45_04870 [Sphingomonas sp. 28-66-16]|nr:MAG: hypothetical protein B7Y45_04870 [Sphingomonas sp. 28-66-16]